MRKPSREFPVKEMNSERDRWFASLCLSLDMDVFQKFINDLYESEAEAMDFAIKLSAICHYAEIKRDKKLFDAADLLIIAVGTIRTLGKHPELMKEFGKHDKAI